MSTITALLITFLAAGCNPTETDTPDGGEPTNDADIPNDGGDADVEPVEDADIPRPDGEPPQCDVSSPEGQEITADPDHATALALASDDSGQLAAAILLGRDSPRDLVLVRFDSTLTPLGDPTLVAAARPFADDPSLIFGHGNWFIAWREAENAEACESDDDCRRELRLAAVTPDGTVGVIPTQLAEGIEIISRPALVADARGFWILSLGWSGPTMNILALPISSTGEPLTTITPVFEAHSLRNADPTAVLVGESIMLVAEASPGGLVAVSLTTDTAAISRGPLVIIEDMAASAPSVAYNGDTLGLTYIDSNPTPPGSRVLFTEFDASLWMDYPPVVISAEGFFPRDPKIAAVGPGWVITWHDGRLDSDPDCSNLGFCRDDVYFVPASIGGAATAPVRVSVDPNDCRDQAVIAGGDAVTAAWLTYRDSRRTAFFAPLPCEN